MRDPSVRVTVVDAASQQVAVGCVPLHRRWQHTEHVVDPPGRKEHVDVDVDGAAGALRAYSGQAFGKILRRESQCLAHAQPFEARSGVAAGSRSPDPARGLAAAAAAPGGRCAGQSLPAF